MRAPYCVPSPCLYSLFVTFHLPLDKRRHIGTIARYESRGVVECNVADDLIKCLCLQCRVLPLSYDARTKGNKLLRWNANQRVRQHAFSNVTISSPNQISSIIYSRFGSNEFNQSTMSQKTNIIKCKYFFN